MIQKANNDTGDQKYIKDRMITFKNQRCQQVNQRQWRLKEIMTKSRDLKEIDFTLKQDFTVYV